MQPPGGCRGPSRLLLLLLLLYCSFGRRCPCCRCLHSSNSVEVVGFVCMGECVCFGGGGICYSSCVRKGRLPCPPPFIPSLPPPPLSFQAILPSRVLATIYRPWSGNCHGIYVSVNTYGQLNCSTLFLLLLLLAALHNHPLLPLLKLVFSPPYKLPAAPTGCFNQYPAQTWSLTCYMLCHVALHASLQAVSPWFCCSANIIHSHTLLLITTSLPLPTRPPPHSPPPTHTHTHTSPLTDLGGALAATMYCSLNISATSLASAKSLVIVVVGRRGGEDGGALPGQRYVGGEGGGQGGGCQKLCRGVGS